MFPLSGVISPSTPLLKRPIASKPKFTKPSSRSPVLPARDTGDPILTSHPVLFFTVYSYMIVYRSKTPIEIVRVLHGKRNVRRLLQSNPSEDEVS